MADSPKHPHKHLVTRCSGRYKVSSELVRKVKHHRRCLIQDDVVVDEDRDVAVRIQGEIFWLQTFNFEEFDDLKHEIDAEMIERCKLAMDTGRADITISFRLNLLINA
jgi:hypothetical protein